MGHTVRPSSQRGQPPCARGREDYLLDFEAPVIQALETVPVPGITHSSLTQWDTTLVLSRNTVAAGEIVQDFEQAWSQKARSLKR